MRKMAVFATLIVLALLAGACFGGGGGRAPGQTLTLVVDVPERVDVGATVMLVATVGGAGASSATVEWDSPVGSFSSTTGTRVQWTAPMEAGTYGIKVSAKAGGQTKETVVDVTVVGTNGDAGGGDGGNGDPGGGDGSNGDHCGAGDRNDPDNPYILCTIEQLDLLNFGHYALGQDIDASATADWDGGRGFRPIGLVGGGAWRGSLDGRGHSIAGLYINLPDRQGVGLFADVHEETVIRDIRLVDVRITGGTWVGGLAGRNAGTITGAYTTGQVTGKLNVGGLVGYHYDGSVTDAHSAADVTGANSGGDIGGLVGVTFHGAITGSSGSGTVTGKLNVGGLVGSARGPTIDSFSTSNVTGTMQVGGLAGSNSGRIDGSYSTGHVEGENDVGGLVGHSNHGTGTPAQPFVHEITESYSTATVVATGTGIRAGGLVGRTNMIISHSYSSGRVTGNGYIGGLAGYNTGQIVHSYSVAEVTGSGSGAVGGLVGWNMDNGSIANSYTAAAATVSGSNVGGLVGTNGAKGSITDSYNDAPVTGDSVGGLVAANWGTIATSFSRGSVSGETRAGGLVATNYALVSDSYSMGPVLHTGTHGQVGGLVARGLYGAPLVRNSFSTGSVRWTTDDPKNLDRGGLIGRRLDEVESSYWDIEASGMTESGGGIGTSTAAMKTRDTYAGWDFGSVWTIVEGMDYPDLLYNPRN